MADVEPDEGSIEFPNRSYRPLLVAFVVVIGVIVTAGRLFFALTDDEPSRTERGSISRHADDFASHPAAVLPDLEELMAAVELPEGPSGGLEVGDSGLSTITPRFAPDTVEATFAVLVVNPHPSWAAVSVEVVVDLVDDGGDVVASSRFVVPRVHADSAVALAGAADDVTGAVAIDVDIEVARWEENDSAPPRLSVEVSDVGPGVPSGIVSTTAVTNHSDDEVADVTVVVVHRDREGRIVGGHDGFVDVLSPDERIELTVENPVDLDPDIIARTDAFVRAETTGVHSPVE